MTSESTNAPVDIPSLEIHFAQVLCHVCLGNLRSLLLLLVVVERAAVRLL
jgi:hypothetical protein